MLTHAGLSRVELSRVPLPRNRGGGLILIDMKAII